MSVVPEIIIIPMADLHFQISQEWYTTHIDNKLGTLLYWKSPPV
jgi:hypothetical protein